MEARTERDVEPGELVVIIATPGCARYRAAPAGERLQCVFEYVYFARPDSVLWGRNVHTVRKALGRQLAREHPVEADIVIPVPDSGTSAALGYSEESGTPVRDGADPQPLRGPHLHRAQAGHPPLRREGEAQPDARDARGPARGRGGRLDRARHHQPQDREDDPQRRRQVGARAHLLAADPVALLLRHRHPDPQGADRLQPHGRGDLPLPRRRLARLSLARRHAEVDRLRPGALLPRLLHRQPTASASTPSRRPSSACSSRWGFPVWPPTPPDARRPA